MKKTLLASLTSILLLSSSSTFADANSCMTDMMQLKPTGSSSLDESLNWVRAARSAAECMHFPEMNGLLDEMEQSIRIQKIRRKQGPQHPCKVVAMRTITAQSQPKYPYVDWFDASAILWNKPEHDPKTGDLIGYDQTLMISMRPDYRERGKDGMVYIGAANDDGVTYLTPKGWENRPTPTPCRPPESIKAEETRQSSQSLADEMTRKVNDMGGLPDDLKRKLSELHLTEHDKPKKQKSKSSSQNLRLCSEEEMVRDTLPSPYGDYPKPDSNGLPPIVTASIYGGFVPLNGPPSWCTTTGEQRIYVGYGVFTDQARQEISRSLTLPEKIIKSMEDMVRQLEAQADTPDKQALLEQIKQQMDIIKVRAARLERKYRAGILRKTAIYRDGYDKQKCWEVARYYCPADTDDF